MFGPPRPNEPAPLGHGRRAIPSISLSTDAARALDPGLRSGLSLRIEPDRAIVGIEALAWPSAAPAILLSIAICWRLLDITATLEELARRSRDACKSRRGVEFLGSRLDEALRLTRLLILDLPQVEGPLTDPLGTLGSRQSARLFRGLVRRLELDRWQDAVDAEIEIIEATFEGLAEERRQRVALACEIVLETLIILAIVADLALNLRAIAAGPG